MQEINPLVDPLNLERNTDRTHKTQVTAEERMTKHPSLFTKMIPIITRLATNALPNLIPCLPYHIKMMHE
jgi:hypothetical protein